MQLSSMASASASASALPEPYVVNREDERCEQVEKAIKLIGTTSSSTDTKKNRTEMITLTKGITAAKNCITLYKEQLPTMKVGLKLRKNATQAADLVDRVKSVEKRLDKYQSLLPDMERTMTDRNAVIERKIQALKTSETASIYHNFHHLIRSVAAVPGGWDIGNLRVPRHVLLESLCLFKHIQFEQPYGLQVALHGFLDLSLLFPGFEMGHNISYGARHRPSDLLSAWLVPVLIKLWDADSTSITGVLISQTSALEKFGTLLREYRPRYRGAGYYLFRDMNQLAQVTKAVEPLYCRLPPELVLLIKEVMLEDRPRILREPMAVTCSAPKLKGRCKTHREREHIYGACPDGLSVESLTCPAYAQHYWCPSTRAWQHDHRRIIRPEEDNTDYSRRVHMVSSSGLTWYILTRCRFTSGACSGHFTDSSWIAPGQENVHGRSEPMVYFDDYVF